jgi:class 3 adenylate cyclase/tetratricopeptide (TPR) repeat protein/ribosomal protein L40E
VGDAVLCTKCKRDNPPDAQFCQGCGVRLELICSACAAPNGLDANFCKKCGARLTPDRLPVNTSGEKLPAQSPSSETTVRLVAAHSDAIDGERKTVTALFADIKGSMELMEELDPEEARAIVDPALKLMINAVHRYDGYIVQSTGDGIFALFGAPVAHEDHPQRALYAALRMQDDLRRYSAKLREGGHLAVEARVGVNTGEVVVRSIRTDDAHTEYTPIGHSTSLASRMQALAPTGSIATTEQTRKLCEGYFSFKPLGPTRIKGVSEPVQVVEVVGLGPLRTRLQVSERRGLTKFVGRQAELEQMRHALELACQGHGQIVAAIGEPGVGKSRLVFEFKAIAQAGRLVLEAYSVSHGKASAYLPVIELLKSYFKITAEDDACSRREKVAGKIVMLDRGLEDTLPYLFGLLGIVEGDDPLGQLNPQLRRRRTLEAVKRILARESLNLPLILIFEDLHWIDSETQALLNLIVDGIATARILLLVNYRPEYQHHWGSKTYYTQLRLDPLGKESAGEMLTALVGDTNELAPLKRLIMERTEGNPFFMEEMVQTLFEQGALVRDGAVKLTKQLDQIRVPPTVQAILASRIDRLSAADKELLQMLAVLGREFSWGLIRRMAPTVDEELERMLSDLQLGEFIYEQPAIGDSEYQFKHALTQEVAYNSVLTERRRILHERAGKAIEALFAERLDEHVAQLAHHYDRSGNVRKAVQYLGRAGANAAQQLAYLATVAYLSRALELLSQLPTGVDRDRLELDLRADYGLSLAMTRGPASPEVEKAVLRTRELSEQLRDDGNLMRALQDATSTYIFRREFPKAREAAERAFAISERVTDQLVRSQAHANLANVLYCVGELDAAREHFEGAIESPERARGPVSEVAPSMASSVAPSILPTVLLLLGYPAASLRKGRESLDWARLRPDPLSLARALVNEAIRQVLVRDCETAIERAQEVLTLAARPEMALYGELSFNGARAAFCRGWAIVTAQQDEDGVAEMRRSLSSFVTAGALVPLFIALLADCYARLGCYEEGLSAVAEGLARAAETGERMAEAELHRVKGELLIRRDPADDDQAERCFRTAIEIARRQKARFWELRASISLARMLKRQDKSDQARKVLLEIYNWFTEGLEFDDLKEAKALLDQLPQ